MLKRDRFNTHFVDSPWRGEEWKKRHRHHRQRQRRGSDDDDDGNDNEEAENDCGGDEDGDVNPLRFVTEIAVVMVEPVKLANRVHFCNRLNW